LEFAMPSDTPPPLPRRRTVASVLGAAAAGIMAGLAAGVSLALPPKAAPIPPSPGRRRFEGKVVAITGATSGIGRAAALAFAAEGAKVAFCGRRTNLGAEVEQQIKQNGGEALYIKADVLVESEVKEFIDRAVSVFGKLDVAFNNAGITVEKPLHDYSAEEWDRVINTNLRGTFLAMKYEIPHMLAAGRGNIVITSSSNAIATTAKRSAYTASKRGLVGLMQSAALDYADKGIRVNALIPGTTDTPFLRKAANMENAPEAIWRVGLNQWVKSNVPGLGRLATAEEVAAFALTLASDDHPFMTGAQMVLDGGKTAKAG
jgi:NAD(P)-dependent dehydrogenase (short-subunit alcohol dehydrogenase family)